MNSRRIREIFTDYFVERGHLAVPSSSLIPNDPTVLLTTAGMQQMTPYFLGLETPPSTRLTSIQKSFRAVGKADDVLEVGDSTHLTFFEMMGNFSVGDYFKEEAIDLAWGLLNGVFEIPKDAFWITVHPDDDRSRSYWRDKIGIPAHKIQSDPENVWGPVGDSGPCGPNSELYVDQRFKQEGDTGNGPLSEDEDRYVEVWNLVFMEFYQQLDRTWDRLERQNVDTGMGLERLAMVLQETDSIYETDLFRPIIERAAEIAGIEYGQSKSVDGALRIVGDHARGIAFLIADGVLPANEDRGYVLRRILRRAVQKGHSLGISAPFVAELTSVTVDLYSHQYPELQQHRRRIQAVVQREEEAFRRTIASGITRFDTLLWTLEETGAREIPGAEAFRLHDTFGFPIDLTIELADRSGFTVDLDGFRSELAAQRERSRGDLARFVDEERARAPLYATLGDGTSRFAGYERDRVETTIAAIIGPDRVVDETEVGAAYEIVLHETPFYGEAGGQVGDTGLITTDTGQFRVNDTQRPAPQIIVHRGEVTGGFIRAGQEAVAQIDEGRRLDIRRNHTATHLLHRALRIVLGDETHQAGSLVAPDRLRFDFTSHEALDAEAIERISTIANRQVLADLPVQASFDSYANAVAEGAMALFGEKYGDEVRVVSIPGFSMELCGGTHVERTGQIGPIVILSESSIGSGIRRIEALTGRAALEYIGDLLWQSHDLSGLLKVPMADVVSGVQQLQQEIRDRDRVIEALRLQLALADVDRLLEQVSQVNGTTVLATLIDVDDRETLLQVGDRLRDSIGSGVIVLGSAIEDRPALLAMVTRDKTGAGLHAGRIIQDIAPIVGGRGGGRPEVAQGGGSDAGKLAEAIAAVPSAVRRLTSE